MGSATGYGRFGRHPFAFEVASLRLDSPGSLSPTLSRLLTSFTTVFEGINERQALRAKYPFKTHVTDRTEFWHKVRQKLVVNPEINTGSPLVVEHRWPPPASRTEPFTVPSSKASDVAQNPYFERDFRRMYPTTAVVTQPELANLLIAQGGFTALPPPASTPSSSSTASKDVTISEPASVPSLSSLYSSSSSPATTSFKPPVPPTRKAVWSPSADVIPHGEYVYFPITGFNCKLA